MYQGIKFERDIIGHAILFLYSVNNSKNIGCRGNHTILHSSTMKILIQKKKNDLGVTVSEVLHLIFFF